MKSQKNTTSEKSTATVAKRSELSLAFVIEVLLLAILLGLVLTDVASATDPNLVGHWMLDEGTGGMLPNNWSSLYERITDSRGIF